MTQEKTIELSSAIDDGHGVPLSHLTMREPLVMDELELENVKGSQSVRNVHLFSRLCGVKPEVLHKMCLRDFNKLSAAYTDFLSPSPEATAAPTPKS